MRWVKMTQGMTEEKMVDEPAPDSVSNQYLMRAEFNDSIIKLENKLLEQLDLLLKLLADQITEIVSTPTD